jgi:hypothetical protein
VTERTPFELATAELRKLEITLRQLPGEYQVNLTGGPDENALLAETLDEAVELGLDMAAKFAPAVVRRATAFHYRRRGRRLTPKALRRRMIRAHNRRMRARAFREQKKHIDEKK